MSFRKLSESEIEALLGSSHKDMTRIKAVIAKYYINGESAVGISIQCDSEYNDSTYDNRLQTVAPLGLDGLEMQPKKGMGPEARRELIDAARSQGLIEYETPERMESDVFIRLNGNPELYVKE